MANIIDRLPVEGFRLIVIGMAIGGLLLVLSNFIPLTEIQFDVVSVLRDDRGTRLYVGDFHFHHWQGGLILCIVAPLFYGHRNERVRKMAYVLFGLGLFFFMDKWFLVL